MIADDGGFFVELAFFADVHVTRGFARRHLAVVEEGGLPVGKTDQHESAAADVARRRFDDGERESGGNGSVHSVAAALQDFDSGLRAEFFVGGYHAMAGANSLGRPALYVVGTVARFRGYLAKG